MAGSKRLNRNVRIAIICSLTVAALALLFVTVIYIHEKEASSDVASYLEEPPDEAGYVDVAVKVISADLSRETMEVEMEFLAMGDLVGEDNQLKQDTTVSVLAPGLREDQVLPAGEFVGYMGGTVVLSGNVSDYPWDRHEGQIFIEVNAPDASGAEQVVPTRLKFYGALPGLDINFTPGPVEDEARELQVAIIRSTVTTAAVCFSILLIWILIATVVSMVVMVLLGHDLQLMMFAFFGTLLFAMTSFRNALPGTPPMGVLSDYLAFFWGYAVAIIALGILTVIWLRRLPSRSELEEKKSG